MALRSHKKCINPYYRANKNTLHVLFQSIILYAKHLNGYQKNKSQNEFRPTLNMEWTIDATLQKDTHCVKTPMPLSNTHTHTYTCYIFSCDWLQYKLPAFARIIVAATFTDSRHFIDRFCRWKNASTWYFYRSNLFFRL